MNDFRILHTYQQLAEAGFVHPLTCACGQDLIVCADQDADTPILRCFACNSEYHLGLKHMDTLRMAVSNYYGKVDYTNER